MTFWGAINCMDFWTSFWRRTDRCRRPLSYGNWCVLWMLAASAFRTAWWWRVV